MDFSLICILRYSPSDYTHESIHFRILFLDGVYAVDSSNSAQPRFRWVRAPTAAQLTQLVHTIARRVARLLEREGLLERDTEQLDLGEVLDEDDPMPDLVGHSITYRIAVGPHRGRKVFTLQTLPDSGWEEGPADAPGNVARFSLHAGVAVKTEPGISMTRPAATAPGPASAAFRSVEHPQRTGKYACGALGHETPQLRDLEPSRDDRAMDIPGWARETRTAVPLHLPSTGLGKATVHYAARRHRLLVEDPVPRRHTELWKINLRPRFARARSGAARALTGQCRLNEGASPFDWQRQGRIGRNSTRCGLRRTSNAALERPPIPLKIRKWGGYTPYMHNTSTPAVFVVNNTSDSIGTGACTGTPCGVEAHT